MIVCKTVSLAGGLAHEANIMQVRDDESSVVQQLRWCKPAHDLLSALGGWQHLWGSRTPTKQT